MADLTPDDIERLIREAAGRVMSSIVSETDRDRQVVVDRAVRDAVVDRDLRDHARHLEEINGSQMKMARSLEAVEDSVSRISTAFEKQAAVTDAIGKYVNRERGFGFNRRLVWASVAAAVAAYASIIALIIVRIA